MYNTMPYFDIAHNARTNPEFIKDFVSCTAAVDRAEAAAARNPRAVDMRCDAIHNLMKMCRYNTGPLVSYFFPRFLGPNPMTLRNHPFSYSCFNLQIGGYTVLRGSRQISKCLAADTYVTIRNKKTGEISKMKASEVFSMVEKLDKT